MTRSVMLVDAGYLLAAGGSLCLGTTNRSEFEVDYVRLVAALLHRSAGTSTAVHLRTYWYDASRDGLAGTSHADVDELHRVRLRLGRLDIMNRQKGVDVLISKDLTRFAALPSIGTIFLVAGDEDLLVAVEDAQDSGVDVVLLTVKATAMSRPARALVHAADVHLVLEELDLQECLRARVPEPQPTAVGRTEAMTEGTWVLGAFQVGYEMGVAWKEANVVPGPMVAALPRLPTRLDAQLLIEAAALKAEQLTEQERKDLRAGFVKALASGG